MKRRRKRVRIIEQSRQNPLPKIVLERPPQTRYERLIKKLAWWFGGGLVAILTIPIAVRQLQQHFEKPHDRFLRENTDTGRLHSPRISESRGTADEDLAATASTKAVVDSVADMQTDTMRLPKIEGILIRNADSDKVLTFVLGNGLQTYTMTELRKGVEILGQSSTCKVPKLFLKLIADRLFVSTTFRDLNTRQTIGVIEYNKWTLYRGRFDDWKDTATKLEVYDTQHNIVFSIEFREYRPDGFRSPIVAIGGYFLGADAVVVHPNAPFRETGGIYYDRPSGCFSLNDSGWREKAQTSIDKMTTVFRSP